MSEGAVSPSASLFNSTIWPVLKPGKNDWPLTVYYHSLNVMVQSNMTPHSIPTFLKLLIQSNRQAVPTLLL